MLIEYSTIHAGSTVENCGIVFISDSIIQSQVTVSGANVYIADSDVKGSVETSGDVLLARSEFMDSVSGSDDYQYSDSFVLTALPNDNQRKRSGTKQAPFSHPSTLVVVSFPLHVERHLPNARIWGSGCAVNTVASNGVTITGSDISTLAITIVHAGYYEFKYEASAQSPTRLTWRLKPSRAQRPYQCYTKRLPMWLLMSG